MESRTKIMLDPVKTPGVFHVEGLTTASADVASRVLQANRANHIFTTWQKEMGVSLHNHTVYHVLSLFALGASPKQILRHAKRNFTYQLLPPKFSDKRTVEDMFDPAKYVEFMGKEEYYLDFVAFFERKLEQDGPAKVLQDYLVGDGEIARSMFPRLWHGYVHAIMHVGLGLEFKQLPILAEGLAEAAVHEDWWYDKFISTAEAYAQQRVQSRQSLVDIFDACLRDPVVTSCVDWDYMNQWEDPTEEYPNGRWVVRREPFRDGVVGKALEPLARLVSAWRVDPDHDDLERVTAELINASIYMAASAQRPPHQPRFDFFIIHGCNAALWHSVYLAEPSITRAQKARMIETTGRMLFFLWAGVGAPRPELDHLMAYKPKRAGAGWDDIFARSCTHEDDGHMIKLIRALANGEKVSRPYDHLPEFRMKQHMFLHAAHAAIDASSDMPMIEVMHLDIIRLVGFPEAWEKVPVME